jgi:GTP cyclohydrolase I
MSRDLAAQHYLAFLDALGLPNLSMEERQQTAQRVATFMEHWTHAARHPEPPALSVFDAPTPSDWVALRDLRFYSFCVHHMVPFFGTVDVAILPNRSLIGFNALARLLTHLSRRPQLQEHLGDALAQTLQDHLKPHGVLVRISARQLCMEMRDHPNATPCISLAARGACAPSQPERDTALRLLA